MTRIKRTISGLIGPRNMGRLDFVRNPGLKVSWEGPFNGQRLRHRIFIGILRAVPITAIVETGTHRGTTTAAFAATGLPVYSIERDPRYFGHSQIRFFARRRHVHLFEGDSRSCLTKLAANQSIPKEDVFFYLDAHWQADLPLREELDIVFANWRRPVVMIDDFHVPDSNYGFDDYGPGKRLDLSYVAPIFAAHRVSAFFPKASASEETGSRRGCIVLCAESDAARLAAGVEGLVRHS